VPLFETIIDLHNARETLDAMLELEPVRQRMAATGRALEVMLGYSDSAKERGPVTATLALYAAQADLAAWAAERSVRLTLFHGRGGALGRGGGPANRAVMAQAPGSVSGRFKVTEQGEVIFARYGNQTLAQRHLEQVTSAVLLTSTPAARRRTEQAAIRFEALARTLDAAARSAYHALIESEGFAVYFTAVTPVRELARMHLGSRPANRGGDTSLASLRAIPWVFAWSQIRLNLPGWYGIGSGLASAPLDELRVAYAEWPLLNVLIDNAEMSLAKTDRFMAAEYLRLGGQHESRSSSSRNTTAPSSGSSLSPGSLVCSRSVGCCPGRSSCAIRTSMHSVISSFAHCARCAAGPRTIPSAGGWNSSCC
jgi:phosphoenolpyruvate carboxylase